MTTKAEDIVEIAKWQINTMERVSRVVGDDALVAEVEKLREEVDRLKSNTNSRGSDKHIIPFQNKIRGL